MGLKRAKVVMLPTNQKTNGMICKDITEQDKIIAIKTKHLMEHEDYIGHHLYIISDEKPDNSDYYIVDGISEVLKNNGLKFIDDNCKKIIATTDTSLTEDRQKTAFVVTGHPLPQPSQQFIEKYIEEYNKGNIITDVLVEYELLGHEEIPSELWEERYKINPKDNTITIKKIKDSWKKDDKELIKAFENFACAVYDENYNKDTSFKKRAELMSKKWIEKNL